jgi:hypothetical protein
MWPFNQLIIRGLTWFGEIALVELPPAPLGHRASVFRGRNRNTWPTVALSSRLLVVTDVLSPRWYPAGPGKGCWDWEAATALTVTVRLSPLGLLRRAIIHAQAEQRRPLSVSQHPKLIQTNHNNCTALHYKRAVACESTLLKIICRSYCLIVKTKTIRRWYTPSCSYVRWYVQEDRARHLVGCKVRNESFESN